VRARLANYGAINLASASEQLRAYLNLSTFMQAKELHRRLGFTIMALVVYRVGTFIPLPGIDIEAFAEAFRGQAGGLLGLFNTFSGGAVERMAIFALNVMPYISASIIVQLVTPFHPPWNKLKKEEGEAGRKQLNQYTRYLTVVLATGQALAIALGLQGAPGMVRDPGAFFVISTVATLTGGAMFLMWLGEQITARGVGNGISLLILAGIVAAAPQGAAQMWDLVRTGAMSGGVVLVVVAGGIAFSVAIVFIELSQRRLPVHYPRRGVDWRTAGADRSFLPLKINPSGVIPPIFASSLLLLPATVIGVTGPLLQDRGPDWLNAALAQLQHGRPLFMALYGALIVYFTFFYTPIVFNPQDTADNLRKYGGFLPGVRPGRATAEYLEGVVSRITVIGAGYITLVCLLPEILISAYGLPFYLGGTSLLIVIVVAIDLLTQVQSHLAAHQYEALIRRSRIRRGPPTSRPAAAPTAPA
jgi:preprotein translocase subunit SecY